MLSLLLIFCFLRLKHGLIDLDGLIDLEGLHTVIQWMCYFGATTETDLDQSSFTEGNGKKHISGEI